jgi:hypothetical protein
LNKVGVKIMDQRRAVSISLVREKWSVCVHKSARKTLCPQRNAVLLQHLLQHIPQRCRRACGLRTDAQINKDYYLLPKKVAMKKIFARIKSTENNNLQQNDKKHIYNLNE